MFQFFPIHSNPYYLLSILKLHKKSFCVSFSQLLVDSDDSRQVKECLLEGDHGVAESAPEPNRELDELEVTFCIDREPAMDFEITNAETSQHFSLYRQNEEVVLVALYFFDAFKNLKFC